MRTALLSLMCLFTSFTAVAESASDTVSYTHLTLPTTPVV